MSVRRRWLLAGLAVGLISLVIRLWLFQQPFNSDDVQYFSQASQAHSLHELGDPTQANGLRLPVVVIPAIYAHVFDSLFTSFYVTIYTYAVLAFAAVFVFAWVVSGPRAAIITAALWATSYVAITIDTRLTPDNLGTAFALFGLALVAWVALPPRAGARPPPDNPRVVVPIAACGGLLLWIAFGCRESFFLFGGVGVGIALLSTRRWLVTAAVAGGLSFGFVCEMIVMHAAFGEALIRFKAAAAYRQNVADSGAAEGTAYSGYHFVDLFTRYPRLLIDASATEAILHFGGLLGFIAWGVRGRDRRNLAKLGAGLAAYGFLAFGIVSVDPVVPVMREKLRYYVTAAPLFYLAVADLIEAGVVARLGGRFARWIDHRARRIGVAAVAALFVLANLWLAAGAKELARNGNDTHWLTAARLRADATTHGRPRVLATDGRTARVTTILMSRDTPWETEDLGAVLTGTHDAYVLLDWKRLNANVRMGFEAAPLTHASYRLIEDHALIGRTVRGANVIDAFFLGGDQRRTRTPIDESFPAAWNVLCGNAKTWAPAVAGEERCPKGETDLILYDGADAPWRLRRGPLGGGQFVEVLVDASAASSTTLRGYLYWWPSHATKAQRQSMGAIEVGPSARTYAMWTYLPQPAEGYRVVLRSKPGVLVTDVQTALLGPTDGDDVRPLGEAWPASPIRDTQLDQLVGLIRADARTRQRALVVYADAFTADTGRAQIPDLDWRAISDGVPDAGYVLVDPARSALAIDLDHAAVVARSQVGYVQFDLMYLDRGVSRDRTELPIDFPSGWSRLLRTPRSVTPIAAATFTSEDPEEEMLYSGTDFVWRPAADQPLDGDRLIEVKGTVSAAGGGDALRVYLYWWPAGQKKEKFSQFMGRVPATSVASTFSVWTYLPRNAGTYRIALRAGDGVTVTDLHAHALGRTSADGLAKLGEPW